VEVVFVIPIVAVIRFVVATMTVDATMVNELKKRTRKHKRLKRVKP